MDASAVSVNHRTVLCVYVLLNLFLFIFIIHTAVFFDNKIPKERQTQENNGKESQRERIFPFFKSVSSPQYNT